MIAASPGRRLLHAAVTLAIPSVLLFQAGCAGDAADPPDPPALVASVQVVQTPDTAYSGESIELRFLVLDQGALPLEGQLVVFTTQDGAVGSSPGVTDAAGEVSIQWLLADREDIQRLTATAGTRSAEVTLRTWPRLVELVLGPPTLLPLGSSVILPAEARTGTGRVVAWTGGFTVEIVSEDRAVPELPVLAVRSPAIEAVGPGAATIRAVAANLSSAAATLAVPRQPILLRVEPADVPQGGGPARLVGHDLDRAIGAVTLDGAPATVLSRSPTAIEVAVPPAPAGCVGRPRLPVEVEGAWQPNGRLAIHRTIGGELAPAVGVVYWLGAGPNLCLKLDGAAGAEYVLGFFDGRGIESAREAPEDPSVASVPWSLRVTDRAASPGAPPASRVARPSTAARPVDLRLPPASAATGEPTDYFLLRSTPWAVGDGFSMPFEGSTVFFEHGQIFAVVGPFAFGSLDRDAAYQIPSRMTGVQPVVEQFLQFGEPVLRNAFIDEWPATTAGSGQTLVLVRPGIFSGFVSIGQGTVDRGMWVTLDPGVVGTPLDQPLFLTERVLYHEMVHAWQDRYAMSRCRDQADCGADYWQHPWAVEGGADFLSRSMLSARYGLVRTGNHSLDGVILNVLGSLFTFGVPFPFDLGYDNSSWFLVDLVERAMRAGHPLDAAEAAVARGSFEGWFGHRSDGGPRRPGLKDRMELLLGASWDPRSAALIGTLTLGADDRSAQPELQVPFIRNAWERWESGATLRIGSGAEAGITRPGLLFGHYLLQDTDGLGGAIEMLADHAGLEWGLVRVR